MNRKFQSTLMISACISQTTSMTYIPFKAYKMRQHQNRTTMFTRFHVHALDLPILSEQTLQVRLPGIVPEVAHENRPHRRNYSNKMYDQ